MKYENLILTEIKCSLSTKMINQQSNLHIDNRISASEGEKASHIIKSINIIIHDIIRQTLIALNMLSLTEFWWPYHYSNHGYKQIMLTPKQKWEHIHNHDAT